MNNTLKRTITGAGIVGAIMASLIVSEYVFVPVMLFAMIVCLAEFYRMTVPGKFRAAKWLALMAAVMLFLFTYLHMSFPYYVSIKLILFAVIPLVVILIASLYIHDADDFDSVAYLFTSQVYIALPFVSMNMVVFDDFGNFNGSVLAGFFILLWASDVGAYLFGMAFGQKHGHKLFPSISPKKSWEGVWGGLFTAVIAGVALKLLDIFDFPWWAVVCLTLLIFVFSIFGDLVESKLKRHSGVKDSGNILPGHGGMLDRFDGALLAFPVATIFLIVFNFI